MKNLYQKEKTNINNIITTTQTMIYETYTRIVRKSIYIKIGKICKKMTRYWGRETARGYENDIQGFNNGWLYGKTSYKQYGRISQPTTNFGL